MKYNKAINVLPIDLVSELQDYVQGEYIYIPVRAGNEKKWGEKSGYREELDERNLEIRNLFNQGMKIDEIAEIYFLTSYAVRKIIYEKERK